MALGQPREQGTPHAPVWDGATKPQVIHDSAYITVWYHPGAKVVHHQIHRAVRGAEYRSPMLKGLECLERHGAKKWLGDVRNHFILPQEDQKWVADVWTPAARKAGWTHLAIVKPELATVALYVNRFASSWETAGIHTHVAETPEAALAWLRRAEDKAGGSAPSSRRSR